MDANSSACRPHPRCRPAALHAVAQQSPLCRRARRAQLLLHSTSQRIVVAGTEQQLEWQTVDQPYLWRGTAETVLAPGSPAARLSPAWRLMILSDGSVTRHLELSTGRETTVECFQMQPLETPDQAAAAAVPEAARRISSPLLQRQSLLRASTGPPLVYASSWWCARTVDRYLADSRQPIWKSLSMGQVEVYREILEVYHGHSPALESLLECPGPFWGRNYFFHHNGRPLTLIHEVFSNRLEACLGPQLLAQRQQHQQPQ